MKKESLDQKKSRSLQIIKILKKTYPDAKCSLDFESPFQLAVATILSAQCTDVRVNMVTPGLFKNYPDASSMAKANLSDIEKLIKSTGFYKNKAKSLIEMSKSLIAKHGGEIPKSLKELIALRGIGRKTANVILGNAFGIPGLVVDTHVGRLARRLGLTKNLDPVKIEFDLREIIPQKDWTMFSLYLVFHGRARCSARKPDCTRCELISVCPQIDV